MDKPRGRPARPIETAKTNTVNNSIKIGRNKPTIIDLKTSNGSETQSVPNIHSSKNQSSKKIIGSGVSESNDQLKQ